MRRGFTLPELLCVLVVIGVLASIAGQPLGRALDRAAVNEAADRYSAFHEHARHLAVARSRLVRLELDTARRTVTESVRRSGAQWDTAATRPLGRARVSVSQPVVTFSPLGLGFGVSNSRIVFSVGAAAETVTVSRTGRLRRS